MDKYIKAADLLDAIYPVDPENDGSDGCTIVARLLTMTSEELEVMIDNLPAADVEPVVYGEWIESDYGVKRCSACGYEKDHTEDITPRCPNCGAKMGLEGK